MIEEEKEYEGKKIKEQNEEDKMGKMDDLYEEL